MGPVKGQVAGDNIIIALHHPPGRGGVAIPHRRKPGPGFKSTRNQRSHRGFDRSHILQELREHAQALRWLPQLIF
jgi:hypothetical protein